jgi:hypothetical protein
MDDFKKLLFSVLIAFAALIVIFVSFTFIWSFPASRFRCFQQARPSPL